MDVYAGKAYNDKNDEWCVARVDFDFVIFDAYILDNLTRTRIYDETTTRRTSC